MQDDSGDEIAVAISVAMAIKERESAQGMVGKKVDVWRKGFDTKMPLKWRNHAGWKNTGRHESARGRRH